MPRPRHVVVARRAKQHLIELQVTNIKRGRRASQIESPSADKHLTVRSTNRRRDRLEAFQSGETGVSVVQSEIFNVQDGNIVRLEDMCQLAQTRRVAAREDAFSIQTLFSVGRVRLMVCTNPRPWRRRHRPITPPKSRNRSIPTCSNIPTDTKASQSPPTLR